MIHHSVAEHRSLIACRYSCPHCRRDQPSWRCHPCRQAHARGLVMWLEILLCAVGVSCDGIGGRPVWPALGDYRACCANPCWMHASSLQERVAPQPRNFVPMRTAMSRALWAHAFARRASPNEPRRTLNSR